MLASIMKRVLSGVAESLICTALCSEVYEMQISEAAGTGVPEAAAGTESCRFPKLEECAHFHYERVQLPAQLTVGLQTSMDQSQYSQHTTIDEPCEWHMVQVTSGDECWVVQRSLENFRMLDDQLHQCIWDRKISQLTDLSDVSHNCDDLEKILIYYLERFSKLADNSINCGPVLNWFQMDNKGHRLLVPSEESRSINTPAVAAAYSVRRYVSQARDELNLEVGDMISVIDMASPGESMWWRGKRGFQVGFFPQHCVHIIGDKVPRNMPLPPPVVGSVAVSPIKPVLRKHGKLIAFFRSFILNRPSRRKLKQSGILKERVFGCDLGEHLLNSGHDIPMVLKCCAEFIEEKGIVDGIYRLSGITSNIQKLRNAFDEDRIPNLHTEDILQDIHSVASLLKMYFRELPNPLCTYQLYQSFVNAVQGCVTNRNTDSDRERLLKMREAVQKLPPPHYRTLEYLMMHLARVAKHAPRTGMTTRNVAIVWAPNLLRCEELEIGGVAALQGVGVQAVVTEFLICNANLIFCDHLPASFDSATSTTMDVSMSPKQVRPKSLAISTPTKLITLEEARSKHMGSKGEDCGYIEVGGGPSNLPKQYHTIIDLPHGRKRGHSKRSPMGWRSFFSKSRNSSQGAISKPRKASTPGIVVAEKSVTESDLTDMKRKLRSVKSAESLTSGHSEPASNEVDGLAPLHSLNKPPGHNRSVSHDSYFDTLQTSQNNSEGSLLDLSEIQLNFELEESEMRIFSEDESLVSSPRIHKDLGHRRILTRARPEEFNSAANSSNPSPKKQARVGGGILSPELSSNRKRTRLEDQLSDIQYIDCNTPENVHVIPLNLISTQADVHHQKSAADDESEEKQKQEENKENSKGEKEELLLQYQPRNKSPRNSFLDLKVNQRQSLNLESLNLKKNSDLIPKSFTEMNLFKSPSTPTSPNYKKLVESSPDDDERGGGGDKKKNEQQQLAATSPVYENVLTTISITYKSPVKQKRQQKQQQEQEEMYEVPGFIEPNLPVETKTLSQDQIKSSNSSNALSSSLTLLQTTSSSNDRPKSLNDLEDYEKSIRSIRKSEKESTNALFDSTSLCKNSQNTFTLIQNSEEESMGTSQNTLLSSSSRSSDFKQFGMYQPVGGNNDNMESPSDFSLSEVINSESEDNLNTSQSSISFATSPTCITSPNVSPTPQLLQEEEEQEEEDEEENSASLSSTREIKKQQLMINEASNKNLNSLLRDVNNQTSACINTNVNVNFIDPTSDDRNPTSDSIDKSENLDETFFNISEMATLSEDLKPSTLNVMNKSDLIEFSPVVEEKHVLSGVNVSSQNDVFGGVNASANSSGVNASSNSSGVNASSRIQNDVFGGVNASSNSNDVSSGVIPSSRIQNDVLSGASASSNFNRSRNDISSGVNVSSSSKPQSDVLSGVNASCRNDVLSGVNAASNFRNVSSSGANSNSDVVKRKLEGNCEESGDENSIYQQVKYFRRSIHEVNALLSSNSCEDETKEEEEASSFHENLNLNSNSNAETTSQDGGDAAGIYENVVFEHRQREKAENPNPEYEKCQKSKNDSEYCQLKNEDVSCQFKNEDVSCQFKNDGGNCQFKNDGANFQFKNEGANFQFKNEGANCQFKNDSANCQFKNEGANCQFKNDSENCQFKNEGANCQFKNDSANCQFKNEGANCQFKNDSENCQFKNEGANFQFKNEGANCQFKNDSANCQFKNDSENCQFKNDGANFQFKNDSANCQFKNDSANCQFKNNDSANCQFKNEGANCQFKNDGENCQHKNSDVTNQCQLQNVNSDFSRQLQNVKSPLPVSHSGGGVNYQLKFENNHCYQRKNLDAKNDAKNSKSSQSNEHEKSEVNFDSLNDNDNCSNYQQRSVANLDTTKNDQEEFDLNYDSLEGVVSSSLLPSSHIYENCLIENNDDNNATSLDVTSSEISNTNIYENIEFRKDSLNSIKSLDLNVTTTKHQPLHFPPLSPLHNDNNKQEEEEEKPERDKKSSKPKINDKKDIEIVPDNNTSNKNKVKSLRNQFESIEKDSNQILNLRLNSEDELLRNLNLNKGLPPCLRARNLKQTKQQQQGIKARSLDEEEFKKEFGLVLSSSSYSLQRRKSLDEGLKEASLSLSCGGERSKVNTLPKKLNEPKKLPASNDFQHEHEIPATSASQQKLNRERIEKYKEERRKFLHDKYRSESFKEDKDVLLSRLKTSAKDKDEKMNKKKTVCEEFSADSLELEPSIEGPTKNVNATIINVNNINLTNVNVKREKEKCQQQQITKVVENVGDSPFREVDKDRQKDLVEINPRESFRMRAAKFENKNQQQANKQDNNKQAINQDFLRKHSTTNNLNNSNKEVSKEIKNERRRRTFEPLNRERDAANEVVAAAAALASASASSITRSSLPLNKSPRKEANKTSPSYCIKDMKAIFESKSQQQQ